METHHLGRGYLSSSLQSERLKGKESFSYDSFSGWGRGGQSGPTGDPVFKGLRIPQFSAPLSIKGSGRSPDPNPAWCPGGVGFDLPNTQYVLSFGSALLDGWGNPGWVPRPFGNGGGIPQWKGQSSPGRLYGLDQRLFGRRVDSDQTRDGRDSGLRPGPGDD